MKLGTAVLHTQNCPVEIQGSILVHIKFIVDFRDG
jgi:hypothetical protein